MWLTINDDATDKNISEVYKNAATAIRAAATPLKETPFLDEVATEGAARLGKLDFGASATGAGLWRGSLRIV